MSEKLTGEGGPLERSYRFFLSETGELPEIHDEPILDRSGAVIGFVTIQGSENPKTEESLHDFIVSIIDLNAQERGLHVQSDSLEEIEDMIRDTLTEMNAAFEAPLLADEFIFKPLFANHTEITPGTFDLIDHDGDKIGRITVNTFGEAGGGLSSRHVATIINLQGETATFQFEGHDRRAFNRRIEEILTR